MAAYTVPPIYAAFVWWFSTGAVLLLVGRFAGFSRLRMVTVALLLVGSLCGHAMTANDTSVAGAYVAFTSTILLWGAQEIAFLAGWVTGPRPQACPAGATGWARLGFALQAILYHELALLTCGAAILALTRSGANQVGLATFASLWVLRQSAKINLFLGVPVTNDELMADEIGFLRSYFRRQPVSAFFPVSVTVASAVMVVLVQRIVEVAATPFEITSLTLVSALFALGVVEHWFMLLPMPALKLWGWGMQPGSPPETTAMEQGPALTPSAALIRSREASLEAGPAPDLPDPLSGQPQVVVMMTMRKDEAPPKSRPDCARQRLEDQFRQRFREQHPGNELANALTMGVEPATAANGRGS